MRCLLKRARLNHVFGNIVPVPAEALILVSNPAQSILKITLNRSKSLNTINVALLNGLVDCLRAAGAERKRVIVLEGAGERSFCAREDLKQSLPPIAGSAEELRDALERLQDITKRVTSSDALVIAAVQGCAIGGGAETALAANFVIGGHVQSSSFQRSLLDMQLLAASHGV